MSKQARVRSRVERMAREEAARRRRLRLAWTAAAVAIVVAVGGLVGLVVYQATRPEPRSAVPAAAAGDGKGIVLGDGPVTIELYSDYLCPACRAFEADAQDDIDRLLADRRIKLVYRPVAILDRLSTNRYSTRSAAGAACAAEEGKLIPYTKALFAAQPAEGGPGWNDQQLIRLAGEAGVTGDRFARCVRDGRYEEWVGQVTDTMADNNVRGTPTIIVDGEQLPQPTGERLVAAVGAAGGGR